MAPERQVPITHTSLSILENDFANVRDRFDRHMREIEQEMENMQRWHSSAERDFARGLPSQTKTFFGVDSPLVQETSNGREMKLRFDVSDYKPEEIIVKTVDNRLKVTAKHEEKSETRNVFREYKREFVLPKGISPERITSSLSRDGVLTITAPLPAIEDRGEKQIPIGHK